MLDHTALLATNGQKSTHAAAKVVRLALSGRSSLGRVLDIGCGVGNLLWAARPLAVSLTGADVEEAALETARRRMPDARLVSGDVRFYLPVEDAAFEIVRSQTWNATPLEPLNEVLQRGGLGGLLLSIAKKLDGA